MTTDSTEAEATPASVTFSLSILGARIVHVAIFFNHWSAKLLFPPRVNPEVDQVKSNRMVRVLAPLTQVHPGLWRCELPLMPGWHEYLFLVDQVWVMDPDAPEVCPDGEGGFNAARMVEPVAASPKISPAAAGSDVA